MYAMNRSVQTFGDFFESDDVSRGTIAVASVSCINQTCKIHVSAPGFALVFLTMAEVSFGDVISEFESVFGAFDEWRHLW
jgi:hypothetical protein